MILEFYEYLDSMKDNKENIDIEYLKKLYSNQTGQYIKVSGEKDNKLLEMNNKLLEMDNYCIELTNKVKRIKKYVDHCYSLACKRDITQDKLTYKSLSNYIDKVLKENKNEY